jgi:hypothetical protein
LTKVKQRTPSNLTEPDLNTTSEGSATSPSTSALNHTLPPAWYISALTVISKLSPSEEATPELMPGT